MRPLTDEGETVLRSHVGVRVAGVDMLDEGLEVERVHPARLCHANGTGFARDGGGGKGREDEELVVVVVDLPPVGGDAGELGWKANVNTTDKEDGTTTYLCR